MSEGVIIDDRFSKCQVLPMTTTPAIRLTRESATATLAISRPERMNALDETAAGELFDTLRDLERDPSVRAVVLTGEGDNFCAGADLTGLLGSDVMDHAVRFYEWSRTRFGPCIELLHDFPKPVVAAVDGVCVGVGWNLALACDLVIAAQTARFSQIFVRRGLVPDGGGTWMLPRYVGLMRARELMYTGRFVDAPEALDLGLVLRVVPAPDLQATASDLADHLAAAPTRALQFTKALLNRSHESSFHDSITHELTYQALLSQTQDVREGIASFIEKRSPRYVGD